MWCFRSQLYRGMSTSTGCEHWISLATFYGSAISRRTTCATLCRGIGVGEFLLDTEVASRLMRAERKAVTNLRRSGARSVSISSITMAELLYGARLREDKPSVMAAVRAFFSRIAVHPWDEAAAEAHARIRVTAKRL